MKQPPIKTKELSGSTVQIADGQNWEIASITAYGENAQGGTTEAPVALTGISSVTLNDDVTELPIPRPLRRVGDVRDICCTRVKSVYDKRIVIDQNSDIFPSGDVSVVGTSRRFNIELPDLPATPYDVLGAVACDKLPRRTAGGSSGGTYGRDELGISVQNDSNSHSINFRVPGCKTLEEIKSWLTDNPLTVYYQSTSYNGANGLDVCLTEYQNGFVELDGTEDVVFDTYGNTQKRIRFDLDRNAIARYALKFSHGNPGDTPTVTGGISASFNRDVLNRLQIICSPDTWTALGVTDTATAKTWLAAQKAAGTPVQIAYQLATPETYATDPLDFDNAAGPLTVMTGGEVEVTLTHRMLTPYTAWTIQYDSEGEYTGDFFNVEDYDRIKQNIEYLREYAYFLYGGFTMRGMVAVTVESYGYASTIDALDANLEAIAANTFRPPDMMPVKQWRGNQPPPGADDWNRIENTCLLLFEQFERQFACLPKLAFELKGSAF